MNIGVDFSARVGGEHPEGVADLSVQSTLVKNRQEDGQLFDRLTADHGDSNLPYKENSIDDTYRRERGQIQQGQSQQEQSQQEQSQQGHAAQEVKTKDINSITGHSDNILQVQPSLAVGFVGMISHLDSSVNSLNLSSSGISMSGTSTSSAHTSTIVHTISQGVSQQIKGATQASMVFSLQGVMRHEFVLSIPGMADVAVNAVMQVKGGHIVQLRTQDTRLQDWLSGQQSALAEGISDYLGEAVLVSTSTKRVG